jgi:hypothetical protein
MKTRSGKPSGWDHPESLLAGIRSADNPFVRRTVVGVIADVKSDSLDTAAGAEVYVPLEQYRGEGWDNTLMLAVRSSLPTDRMIAAIREQVRALDRDQPCDWDCDNGRTTQ